MASPLEGGGGGWGAYLAARLEFTDITGMELDFPELSRATPGCDSYAIALYAELTGEVASI